MLAAGSRKTFYLRWRKWIHRDSRKGEAIVDAPHERDEVAPQTTSAPAIASWSRLMLLFICLYRGQRRSFLWTSKIVTAQGQPAFFCRRPGA